MSELETEPVRPLLVVSAGLNAKVGHGISLADFNGLSYWLPRAMAFRKNTKLSLEAHGSVTYRPFPRTSSRTAHPSQQSTASGRLLAGTPVQRNAALNGFVQNATGPVLSTSPRGSSHHRRSLARRDFLHHCPLRPRIHPADLFWVRSQHRSSSGGPSEGLLPGSRALPRMAGNESHWFGSYLLSPEDVGAVEPEEDGAMGGPFTASLAKETSTTGDYEYLLLPATHPPSRRECQPDQLPGIRIRPHCLGGL
jgi:hypothetical protein